MDAALQKVRSLGVLSLGPEGSERDAVRFRRAIHLDSQAYRLAPLNQRFFAALSPPSPLLARLPCLRARDGTAHCVGQWRAALALHLATVSSCYP